MRECAGLPGIREGMKRTEAQREDVAGYGRGEVIKLTQVGRELQLERRIP